MDFTGKVALITGSSTGIGKATALAFAEHGADIVVHCNESVKAAEAVVQKITSLGRRALLVRGDVSDGAQVQGMIDLIRGDFGRVDILVNNAGSLVQRATLESMEEELWDRVMNLNLKSVYLVTRAVLPMMKAQGGGRVINLTSIAARHGGSLGSVAYATSKGGVKTLTHGLAKELAPYNILVNAVAPGIIATPFQDRFSPPDLRKTWESQIPLHREGSAEETARPILFLASSYADYITGQVLDVNGGQWMS